MSTSIAQALKPLLAAATVGTERMPAPRTAPEGAVGAMLERLAAHTTDADPATQLLRTAGVLAVCAQAGHRAAPTTIVLPAAPDDTTSALGHPGACATIASVLREGPVRLQFEALARVSQHGWRLPPGLLPLALDAGRRSTLLREPLDRALGERGRWLAAQQPVWQYAVGSTEREDRNTRWDEGSLEQRRVWLRDERATDPAAARARFETALAELPARERADLLAVLAVGLSADDETLLDKLRRDRSRDVRQAALGLLLRLPDTAHGARAAQRMSALVRQERGLIRKHWTIDAPQAAADDWKADDIDAARPKHESLGERAWWLYQLVRQVPLAWWRAHTEMDPAALITWAIGTDWAEAMLRGWHDVLLVAPDADWARAFLDAWSQSRVRIDPASVLALLPVPQREQYWLHDLDRDAGMNTVAAIAEQLVGACAPGETMSAAFSQRYVGALLPLFDQLHGALRAEYTLRNTLPDLICVLDLAALAPLQTRPMPSDAVPAGVSALQSLIPIITARQTLAAMPVSHRRSPS